MSEHADGRVIHCKPGRPPRRDPDKLREGMPMPSAPPKKQKQGGNMSEWISVDERLPERGTFVFGYATKLNWRGEIFAETTGPIWGESTGNITHWYPIPQPGCPFDYDGLVELAKSGGERIAALAKMVLREMEVNGGMYGFEPSAPSLRGYYDAAQKWWDNEHTD